jgi:hypothetical protein
MRHFALSEIPSIAAMMGLSDKIETGSLNS